MQKPDTKRPPWVKWYKTSAWQKIRASQLSRNPLCEFCNKKGIITPANTVDHKVPHKGNMELFFSGPFSSLCKSCHSSTKQRIEKSGEFGCDVNGIVPDWKD